MSGPAATVNVPMPVEPIRFYHRYKKAIEEERIFGEGWMRFAYENPAGRFFVWLLARRAFFSLDIQSPGGCNPLDARCSLLRPDRRRRC